MAIVACQASDFVAGGVARERPRDGVDVVGGELLQGGVELRELHDRHSRHTEGSSWGISGVGRTIRVNGVFPGWSTATPCGRAGASDLAADQPVEDVGLGDQHLVEPEHPQDRRRARRRRRRSRRPVRARARGCARAAAAVSVASVRNTSSAASRVSPKWWIRSGSYSGRPSSIAATVVTVPASPTSVAASAAPGITRGTSATWSRTTATAFDELLGRGRVGVEELLGDAHAADVDRHEPSGVVGAEHELGRAAADVDDEVRRGRVEVGGRAEERQRGLLVAGEQLGRDTRARRARR